MTAEEVAQARAGFREALAAFPADVQNSAEASLAALPVAGSVEEYSAALCEVARGAVAAELVRATRKADAAEAEATGWQAMNARTRSGVRDGNC